MAVIFFRQDESQVEKEANEEAKAKEKEDEVSGTFESSPSNIYLFCFIKIFFSGSSNFYPIFYEDLACHFERQTH